MKAILSRTLAGMGICALLCCSPKPYTKVVVRPATCSDHIQFAAAASPGHLFEFAGIVRKPVFMAFHLPWIDACKRMDQHVYRHPDLAGYFNRKFINYKIDPDASPVESELANRFGVTVFPTFLFVDSYGKVIWRHEGPLTAAQLMETGYRLNDALEKEYVTVIE